jgi:hypothetical protein
MEAGEPGGSCSGAAAPGAAWATLPDSVLEVRSGKRASASCCWRGEGGSYARASRPAGKTAQLRGAAPRPACAPSRKQRSRTQHSAAALAAQVIGRSFVDARQLEGASRVCKGWRRGFALGMVGIELTVHRDSEQWCGEEKLGWGGAPVVGLLTGRLNKARPLT